MGPLESVYLLSLPVYLVLLVLYALLHVYYLSLALREFAPLLGHECLFGLVYLLESFESGDLVHVDPFHELELEFNKSGPDVVVSGSGEQ